MWDCFQLCFLCNESTLDKSRNPTRSWVNISPLSSYLDTFSTGKDRIVFQHFSGVNSLLNFRGTYLIFHRNSYDQRWFFEDFSPQQHQLTWPYGCASSLSKQPRPRDVVCPELLKDLAMLIERLGRDITRQKRRIFGGRFLFFFWGWDLKLYGKILMED